MKTGAKIQDDGSCLFSVWAPEKDKMELRIIHPFQKTIEMQKDEEGYFTLKVDNIDSSCRYMYIPDGKRTFPDPSSHYQPEGVHGPSQVIDHSDYKWNDSSWKGIPLKDMIMYELHAGTFTREGTFEAVIPRLDELASTGINAIELMPVSQFPGERNWGYDGVFPYAVQNSYGGTSGLKKLVDAAHQRNIAVILDVVYNHVGPEGNYLSEFAPYFTNKYRVPWGDAVNFDGSWSDGVREYFAENACHWFENYHIDGLRIDAIHMVFDSGAVHFWEYMHGKIESLEQLHGRKFYTIAESDLNSPKVVNKPESGGYGFDAQWLDDYHHALYVLLHPEGKDRYEDFGTIEQLEKAYRNGFVHSGEFVRFRKRKYGSSSAGIRGNRFIVFNQNHDQVGNRVLGERLCMLTGLRQLKMAAAALLLSPYIPMLFMGEEYGDETPFFYFVSHSDPDLVKAVREGRKKEFEGYKWNVEPPDPQDENTFLSSKLNWELRNTGRHKILLNWNIDLIKLRNSNPALANMDKDGIITYTAGGKLLAFVRASANSKKYVLCILNFSGNKTEFTIPDQVEKWKRVLDSCEEKWKEPGESGSVAPFEIKGGSHLKMAGWSVVVYEN